MPSSIMSDERTSSADQDLSEQPPRRWSDAVDGVIWLPRIADKARAFDTGRLGTYLFGHSPIDDAFLKAARLDYTGFLDLARRESDDASLLAAIDRASPGARDRLQRWSQAAPRKLGPILYFIDLDDGYRNPWWMRLSAPVVRHGANLVARGLQLRRSGVKRTS